MSRPDSSFHSLVAQYLGEPLPDWLADEVCFSELPAATQAFITRALAVMKRSGYSGAHFSPYLLYWLTVMVPRLLWADAWGDRIPPYTTAGRHRRIDDYVAHQRWPSGSEPHTLVDLGCGFPPLTSADTARRFPDWRIYGVDRSFAEHILYHRDGHYACFGSPGGFLYFQARPDVSRGSPFADPLAAKACFNGLFDLLSPSLPNRKGPASVSVEQDGHKLVRHPIRDYETRNLAFVEAEIGDLDLPAAKVVRCMNVLIYFEPEIRQSMVLAAGRLLDEAGLLIVGTNGFDVQSRYFVYRKGRDGLGADEFAFSLDNLGHFSFMPWLTIHDRDPEAVLLGELAGVIRGDASFWPAYSARLDELLETHDLGQRQPNGFFQFPNKSPTPSEFWEKNALVSRQVEEEGFADRAVDVLVRAGYRAWKNPVGDIAVQAPANVLGLDQ